MSNLPPVDNKGSTASGGSKGSKGLPAEGVDGRMGADIQLLITDITDYRDLMVNHTTDDKANLRALDEEIEILEYRQAQIDSRLGKRKTAKDEYLKTLADTEKAFNQIVNTANAVAGILKPKSASELASMDAPKSVSKAGDYRGKEGQF